MAAVGGLTVFHLVLHCAAVLAGGGRCARASAARSQVACGKAPPAAGLCDARKASRVVVSLLLH